MSYAPLYKVIKVESVMASLWELGPVIFGPTEDFVSPGCRIKGGWLPHELALHALVL